MMPKVLFLDSNHPLLHETLIAAGFNCDLFYDRTDEELLNIIPQYDVLVIRSKFKITEEILRGAKNLKCIARAGAGLENIDVDAAGKLGIKCVHAPEGNRQAVAEHALGMLLALFNKLIIADAEVRHGFWRREKNRGIELSGKTVGIIGYGNTGAAFANLLKAFRCRILVYDKYKNDIVDSGIEVVAMDEIYKHAEIVSLHVPLTNETNFLVNINFINSFRNPFFLINTSRGKCVKTIDLVNALNSNKVRGACLDVLEFENVSFEGLDKRILPLELQDVFNSNKTILSPHIAGWTYESHKKIAEVLAEKIIKAFK
jgi:D-3-phosphoglycerate dehydrogenase